MLQYDFENSIGYWVCVTSHAIQRAFKDELGPTGITFRQWQVLAWLVHDGPLTQANLAERMDIEAATLVSVLGRMQRDGLIAREDCPNDRRKKLIRPTDLAEPMWEEGVACARRVRARLAQGLTSKQVNSLRQMLEQVRDNIMAAELAATEK